MTATVDAQREAKYTADDGATRVHAGLPKPTTNSSAGEQHDRMTPTQNKISIWVPTSAVMAGGAWDASLFQVCAGNCFSPCAAL